MAEQDIKLNKEITSGFWREIEEQVIPFVREKCSTWAQNDRQYLACKRAIARSFASAMSNRFINDLREKTDLRQVRAELRRTFYMPLSTTLGTEIRRKFLDAIKNGFQNAQGNDKEMAAVYINTTTELMRGALAGFFAGSKPPSEKYEIKGKKKKKPGEIERSPEEEETFRLSRIHGRRIQDRCKLIADSIAERAPEDQKDDVRAFYYHVCRMENAYHGLNYVTPSLDTIETATKVDVQDVLDKSGLSDIRQEALTRFEPLIDNAVVVMEEQYKNINFDEYLDPNIMKAYAANKIRHVMSSVLGSAISRA